MGFFNAVAGYFDPRTTGGLKTSDKIWLMWEFRRIMTKHKNVHQSAAPVHILTYIQQIKTSLSCIICFVDSLFVPRVQVCHIPVVTAWIFFNGNLGFTGSHLSRTLRRKPFVLMERREDQTLDRVQTGPLLMTPPVPDVLLKEIWFGGNIYLLRFQFPSIILSPPLQKPQIGMLNKAAKLGNGRLIKKSKGIN